jgi:hypothetical protein
MSGARHPNAGGRTGSGGGHPIAGEELAAGFEQGEQGQRRGDPRRRRLAVEQADAGPAGQFRGGGPEQLVDELALEEGAVERWPALDDRAADPVFGSQRSYC